MSLYEALVGVAIWEKLEQPAPWHRSTLYPVTPTLSVEAVHERLICELEAADAARFVGADGGIVSGAAVIVTMDAADFEESA